MAYSLLALGDSYTIGEGVAPEESFPCQAVRLLQNAGQSFQPPDILARTGWTTDELAAAMAGRHWEPPYDFVTLLIGVNNQYRGRDVEEYAVQFEKLLHEAMRLGRQTPATPSHRAGASSIGRALARPLILSIPDWSVSPFAHTHLPDAKGRTRDDVAAAIDAFNATAAGIARRYDVIFIDITTHGRAAGSDPALFTTDGLHPGADMYRFWAERVAGVILKTLTP
jgi:lysophospholipase L1-like esterase